MKKVINVSQNKFVTDGPHLWVSSLLQKRGSISGNKIWEEYQKDLVVCNTGLIASKTKLKDNILKQMLAKGKIQKGSA